MEAEGRSEGTVCSWCRLVYLEVDGDDDDDDDERRETSSSQAAVAEPLCSECFEEVTRLLECRIQEVTAAGSSSSHDDDPVDPVDQHRRGGRSRSRSRGKSEGSGVATSQRDRIALGSKQLRALSELQAVEDEYFMAHNALHFHLLSVADKRDTLQRKMERAERYLDASSGGLGYFKIGAAASTIGTINGFRLGTLSTDPVDWQEINCAWGVAVLLLERLRVEVLAPLVPRFAKCWVIEKGVAVEWAARGSWSNVTVDGTTYELVGPVSKIFCPGYDRALVLFLQCLDVAGRLAQGSASGTASSTMPHEITGERIGGVSIRRGLSRDVTWTTALRNVLENLRWLSRQLMSCRVITAI